MQLTFNYTMQFGDYVFFNASLAGISPLDGFTQFLGNRSSSTKINFAQGCELWSNDDSGIPAAVQAAQNSDVAIVMVSINASPFPHFHDFFKYLLGWHLVT